MSSRKYLRSVMSSILKDFFTYCNLGPPLTDKSFNRLLYVNKLSLSGNKKNGIRKKCKQIFLYCCRYEFFEIVNYFIKLNISDRLKSIGFKIAVQQNSVEIVKLFLEDGIAIRYPSLYLYARSFSSSEEILRCVTEDLSINNVIFPQNAAIENDVKLVKLFGYVRDDLTHVVVELPYFNAKKLSCGIPLF